MKEATFFILGTMLGGMFGAASMCILQINRTSERRGTEHEKEKCADTFSAVGRRS